VYLQLYAVIINFRRVLRSDNIEVFRLQFSLHVIFKEGKKSPDYNYFYDRVYFKCQTPHKSHGLIFYTCSRNLGVLLNWRTLKTAARVRVLFLFLYFTLSYEFKIRNSVKVQCRNRGYQIDSNGQKS